jgi:hypothetical protein
MEAVDDEKTKTSEPLLGSEDYYMENGLMVFTAAYHRKRGYCCGSGCRHCPYRDAADAASDADRTSGSQQRATS